MKKQYLNEISIANIIKSARLAKGLTQKEVAKMIGIELNSYQNYEYDKRVPTGNIFISLMKVLDLDISDF